MRKKRSPIEEMKLNMARDLKMSIDDEVFLKIWRQPCIKESAEDYMENPNEATLSIAIEDARKLKSFWFDTEDAPEPEESSSQSEHVNRTFSDYEKNSPLVDLLNQHEEERMKAYSAYIARLARSDEAVKEFQHKILRDQTLTREQAVKFIWSDAVRWITTEEFIQFNIDPVEHTASVSDEYMLDEQTWGRKVVVDPPRTIIETRRGPSIDNKPRSDHASYYSIHRGFIEMWRGSVADKLYSLTHTLHNAYGWETDGAALFVLADITPLISPIRMSTGARLTSRHNERSFGTRPNINITFAPWLSDETVIRIYRRGQRTLAQNKERNKQSSRGPSARNFRVFRFVEERTSPEGKHDTWPKLMAQWNEEFPSEPFTHSNNFWNAYDRGREQILFPHYGEHYPSQVFGM